MTRLAVLPALFAIALAILPAVAHAIAPDSDGIAVAIHRDGEAFVVDVDFTVDATPQEAWNVLTDYDHMSEFVSDLTMSRIVRHAGDSLEVAQTSRVKLGFLDFKFENVREIEFVPLHEIRSKLVRGDMKVSAFTTRLAAEGNATRITNHGRFIPDRWIPPLIGPIVLEAETRKQFAELRAEILRRKYSWNATPR
ncbi:MAG TPA: SRPBCC family protein [Casimicrobiaceae bacterium]|nr:SRPBCC family protein [Casimicrobiaceae bacterium]